MKEGLDLSLVIPVLNEIKNLDELIDRCMKVCEALKIAYEIILVDDGSTDGSTKKILDAARANCGRLVGVILNRNYGQHPAVMAGLAQSRGQAVITLDADLQNPPEEIPKLFQKIQEGFDVVGTVRTERQDTLFRRLASFTINMAARKATGVSMHDYGCMLRAYARPVVDAMLRCHERSTFIPVLANSFAKNTVEIPVRHEGRMGESKYSFWKLINLQFDLLTTMTTFPLRLLSLIGGFFAALGLTIALLLIALRLIHGPEWAAQGVFTLFAALFFFVGAQFTAMGLMGEYIGRIYQDVRARPRYFIQQVAGAEKRIEESS
ncbi:MAG: undecaprenyl-phosphate 4-deoxy-4-formamido-L-arabinose transferase [Deltaproteobacteria bacterium CG_4_8_14_3_um_filter_51_11]